ncbi:MAG: hypothetical protein ACKVOT_05805 [Polaromonas sp.]
MNDQQTHCTDDWHTICYPLLSNTKAMSMMLTSPCLQRFLPVSFVLLLGGCAFWSDQTPEAPASRVSVQLSDTPAPTSRSAWLQHQVTAMDVAAFDGQRSGVNLKLSYQLTLAPRKT